MNKLNTEYLRETQRKIECERALNGSNTFVSMEYKYRNFRKPTKNVDKEKGDWYLTFQCNEMDCRRTWSGRADLITQPNNAKRCPCMHSRGGFDVLKPGTWYLLFFNAFNEQFIKAGVTNKTVAQRYYAEQIPYNILKEIDFDDGQECWDYEQKFLRNWKEFKHIPENKLKVNGDTECFKLQLLTELGIKIPNVSITGDLTRFGL
tara:strand:+ start:1894 stop:2508 length:615 start_codon:yes stop_codon:yes gene_type:complete